MRAAKIIQLILLVCLVIILAGCSSGFVDKAGDIDLASSTEGVVGDTDVTSSKESVSSGVMYVTSEVISADSLTATIKYTNPSDSDILYNYAYLLSVRESDRWKALKGLPDRPNLISYGCLLKAGGDVFVTYNYGDEYGELPSGHYRLLTKVTGPVFSEVVVEFDI